MKRDKNLLIFYVPAGGGHKAAAKALAEVAAARGLRAEIVDALELTPAWFARAYVGTHLRSTEHVPAFYGTGYAALNHRHALVDSVRGMFDRTIGASIKRFAASSRCDAILSTHFFPLAVLGHARRTFALQAPLIGVVTDYAAHAFWAERGIDRFCAPRGRAERDLERHGVAPEAIVATGIPIRTEFGTVSPLVPPEPRAPLEVLITSGGFGIGPMVEIIRSFATVPRVKLTVICGDNPGRIAKARRAASQAGVQAEVLGFEKEMPRRMERAHVLVGKPGGLTVSEALAAGRPMVLVGTCPGQEQMNQAFLVEHGAAIAVSAAEAGRAVARIRARGLLGAFAQAARSLAAPDAAEQVLDVTQRLINAPFRNPALAAA